MQRALAFDKVSVAPFKMQTEIRKCIKRFPGIRAAARNVCAGLAKMSDERVVAGMAQFNRLRITDEGRRVLAAAEGRAKR